MRRKHPRIGKKKLTPLLMRQCSAWNIPAPRESTVGRILSDLKKRDLLPTYTKVSLYQDLRPTPNPL
jgi:hypothetical protein